MGRTENRRRAAAACLLTALSISVTLSRPVRSYAALPETISLTQGGTARLDAGMLEAHAQDDSVQVLSGTDERLSDKGIELVGDREGNCQLVFSFLGLPVKTVNVNVVPKRYVVPGGQSIGVALDMAGVLVVGASDVGSSPSPARQAGLRPGDLIVAVNGAAIESAQGLSGALATGKSAQLLISRAGRAMDLTVVPVRDSRDGAYRLGAWVRDSTAGVGTLSYYDPETQAFGALGHAITDVDTGTVLTVSEGEIYESNVVGIVPGGKDGPGELLGEFMSEPVRLGSVLRNGEYGIYGVCEKAIGSDLFPEGVEVLMSSQVREGPAQLLTTLDGRTVKAYDCMITKLYHQDSAGQRGMVVKITDDELLAATGGIVQGMSGSPVLQDGKLAGAVTHVFLDDSTQGYGMYAEWMLDQSDQMRDAA